MEPVPNRRVLTIEDLEALPDDGRRYELEAGRLLAEPPPAPLHGRIVTMVATLLQSFVRPRGLGVVLTADAGFVLGRSPDTMRGPDVAFVTRERYEGLADETRAFPGPPDLAVEVLSPSARSSETHSKVADYLAAGTRLVWVVDPQLEQVTVYRSLLGPRRLDPQDELDGEDVLPGFRAAVREVFER
jgi:Uma2 family endonuclease